MEEIQSQPPVPPTLSSSFGRGWETLKRYFPEFLLILCIIVLFSLPMGLVDAITDKESFGHLFLTLFNIAYGLLIMAPLHYGAAMLAVKAARGEKFHVNEIFMAYRKTLQVVLATLLTGLIIGLGFVLLIVPGIIFACKLSMVKYLVMDQEMEAVEAVRTSWRITKGYSWTVFWMGFLSFFIIIGGLVLLVVGIFPAIIWIQLGFAALYAGIQGQGVS